MIGAFLLPFQANQRRNASPVGFEWNLDRHAVTYSRFLVLAPRSSGFVIRIIVSMMMMIIITIIILPHLRIVKKDLNSSPPWHPGTLGEGAAKPTRNKGATICDM